MAKKFDPGTFPGLFAAVCTILGPTKNGSWTRVSGENVRAAFRACWICCEVLSSEREPTGETYAVTFNPRPALRRPIPRSHSNKIVPYLQGRPALEIAHSFYNGSGGNILEAVEAYDALIARVKELEAKLLA